MEVQGFCLDLPICLYSLYKSNWKSCTSATEETVQGVHYVAAIFFKHVEVVDLRQHWAAFWVMLSLVQDCQKSERGCVRTQYMASRQSFIWCITCFVGYNRQKYNNISFVATKQYMSAADESDALSSATDLLSQIHTI